MGNVWDLMDFFAGDSDDDDSGSEQMNYQTEMLEGISGMTAETLGLARRRAYHDETGHYPEEDLHDPDEDGDSDEGAEREMGREDQEQWWDGL